jgi:hypothetical protein
MNILVVNKSLDDFGPMQGLSPSGTEPAATQIMRISAPLLCYWMGETELPGDAE